ncbi:hypothetical protein KAR48_07265, partial [bacterium]|nr:hypothetical protein [bacterium]
MKLSVLGSFYLVLLSYSMQVFGETYTVTHTGDDGVGSLRQAISDANIHAGPDTIKFNIPDTDDGYDSASGTWIIQPVIRRFELMDGGTYLDGFSQSINQGDANIFGPEIVL